MAAGAGEAEDPARLARRLARTAGRATLATVGADGGPLATLVLTASAQDGAILLLLSAIAAHSRNIAADPRVSLLFMAGSGGEGALTRPRVSISGRALRHDDTIDRRRFLARHPAAAEWAGLPDFALLRVVPESGHLVAGFARTHRLAGPDLLVDAAAAAAMRAAEADILAHMNEDHAEAVALYATALLGARGKGWRMTGIDPEGCDLRRPPGRGTADDRHVARLAFPDPVDGPDAARRTLATLARRARETRRN